VVAVLANSTWVTANYQPQVVLVVVVELVCTMAVQDIQVRQN
jgi:hypothetical protein